MHNLSRFVDVTCPENGRNTVNQLRMKNKLNRSFHSNNIYQNIQYQSSEYLSLWQST